MSRAHDLTIPLQPAALAAVAAGNTVYLTGPLFTARPRWYRRVLAEGQPLPVDLKALGANVLFHTGPLVRRAADGSWEVVAIVPMPDWIADGAEGNVARIIPHLGLRAVIGKGLLDGTEQICKTHQCLHLITLGTWNNFARQITRVLDVGWLDLGMAEAMWVFEVNRMGPFVVETDAHGRSLYEASKAEREARQREVLKEMGLEGFQWSTPQVPE